MGDTKQYCFKFHTTYLLPDGTCDPTTYVAYLGNDGNYHVNVQGDEQDLFIEFTVDEVFRKWAMREWIVLRK